MMKHMTLASPFAEELVVKRSRFIACASQVSSVQLAQLFFDDCRAEKASHNCWAYKIGEKYRFNDDGEPSGTAGKPIFAAIESSGLDNVAVLVVRYFGGIKLGAGGLTRAYGNAAAQCLRNAPKVEVTPTRVVRIGVSFRFAGAVMHRVEAYEKLESEFGNNGSVITVSVPEDEVDRLRSELMDLTNGSAMIEEEDGSS